MSAINLDNQKRESAKRYSLARRLVYGPAFIFALGAGSSAGLAAALLLSSMFEF
jgi:hypothetical protein